MKYKLSQAMGSIVGLRTMYVNDEDRNIECLSSRYTDFDALAEDIRQVSSLCFDKTDIESKKILIKPNWVKHPSSANDEICLCTNENFILAVVRVVLEYGPLSIIIGDAPIQGCDWEKLLSRSFMDRITSLSKQSGVMIQVKDFRKVRFSPSDNEFVRVKANNDDYVEFDIGSSSYLEDITQRKNRFRVTCYNPSQMAEAHSPGHHKYCIAKEVFECDTIITLPKIKTHQKAGMTNALKILVGVIGDKACLPHHRLGAVGHGGDCYKGWNLCRNMSEVFSDWANLRIGKRGYTFLNRMSYFLWGLSNPDPTQNLSAGWYGNDTVWRMVLDINAIAVYGRKDGSLSQVKERTIYSICDGIIAGQGNGPLNPTPLPLGVILCANDSFWADEVAGHLLRLNVERIPILRESRKENEKHECTLIVNGAEMQIDDLSKFSMDVIMPDGWTGYNN